MDGPSGLVPCHSTPKKTLRPTDFASTYLCEVPLHTTANAKESDQSPRRYVRFDRLGGRHQICT